MVLLSSTATAQDIVTGWRASTPKDALATLEFGALDAPTIAMGCARKSGQVAVKLQVDRQLADHRVGQVWVDHAGVAAPWPASVTFAAGTATSTLRGLAQPMPDQARTAVGVEISTAAPVMKAFAKTGAISLTSLGQTLSPAASKPAPMRKFLNACK